MAHLLTLDVFNTIIGEKFEEGSQEESAEIEKDEDKIAVNCWHVNYAIVLNKCYEIHLFITIQSEVML